jgi:hypothetical protein
MHHDDLPLSRKPPNDASLLLERRSETLPAPFGRGRLGYQEKTVDSWRARRARIDEGLASRTTPAHPRRAFGAPPCPPASYLHLHINDLQITPSPLRARPAPPSRLGGASKAAAPR